jgi:threonine/homoserine/homoserine lactone efflux protein
MDISLSTLLAFVAASFVICIAPGPAVIYISGRTLAHGRRVGLFSMFGIFLGCLVHVVAVVFGLSAVLLKSAELFSLIKFLGALYLIYLGIKVLVTDSDDIDEGEKGLSSSIGVVRQGIIIAVLNPKIAIFFVAYLPQFIMPSSTSLSLDILLFGVLFTMIAAAVNACLVLTISTMSGKSTRVFQSAFLKRWLPGAVLVALGAQLALSQKN